MQVGSPHFTTRMHQAIEKSILDKIGNNGFVRRMNGEVTSVSDSTMTASVKILGNTSASTGFKIRSAILPVVGDLVSVCIDGQERWIESILAGSTQKKLVIGSDGLFKWGPGGGSYDTTLSRVAVSGTAWSLSTERLRLTASNDASVTSTQHAFQIGPTTDANLVIDVNEIQARDNDAATKLFLNNGGGVVEVGAGGIETNGGIIGIAPIVRVYTSNTTWNKPTGLSNILVESIGGGGGGGSTQTVASGSASSGGGGGGGAYARKFFNAADLPSSCTVTVGTGGSGGTAGNDDAAAGNASTFSGTGITTVSAGGGNQGGRGGNSSGTGLSTHGGLGGTASGGDINATGGHGNHGLVVSGVALPTGNGGAAPVYGGGTRAPATSNGAGASTSNYGNGGSGATSSSGNGGRAGGSGSNGLVVVYEFYGP